MICFALLHLNASSCQTPEVPRWVPQMDLSLWRRIPSVLQRLPLSEARAPKALRSSARRKHSLNNKKVEESLADAFLFGAGEMKKKTRGCYNGDTDFVVEIP